MRKPTAHLPGIVGIALFIVTQISFGDDQLELGVRASVFSAGGEPANDIIGGGVFGKYQIHPNWYVGAAIDLASHDFERPAKIAGVTQSSSVGTIDATADSTAVTGWIERRYDRPNSRVQLFWTAGGGFNSVDVDNVTGPVAGGGTFDLKTDVDTEFLLTGSVGFHIPFAKEWNFEGALRLEQHFADWKVTDRVTGKTGTVDDYTARGIHLGISRSLW